MPRFRAGNRVRGLESEFSQNPSSRAMDFAFGIQNNDDNVFTSGL
ncbi:hypothetical protein AVEN_202489-1, partial [Araneus ventricosus]